MGKLGKDLKVKKNNNKKLKNKLKGKNKNDLLDDETIEFVFE